MSTLTTDALQEWLCAQLAKELELPAGSIDPAEPMATYGLDSVRAITLLTEVEDHVGFEIDPNALWEFPTVAAFAEMVVGQMVQTERS
ncbi:acyl carrier protein [Nonomuraea turkmeniaca]|uniref:Acyl carrier protein n=1 Tax=Nonomuraea turkmeniaca TaxID=103838 RepID=A0A5S4FIR6_9ACTN|nr:acyl carrier protein [Nonomuraea turkmeniaca]TMR20505.1 acyl carrier protein [Nonomuraea turkmeniaca]